MLIMTTEKKTYACKDILYEWTLCMRGNVFKMYVKTYIYIIYIRKQHDYKTTL